MATAIYFLLTPDTFSEMHRLPGEEVYHFYLGDAVELLQLAPDSSGEMIVLGTDIAAGMKVQHVVPGGCWQGSRLRDGGKFALLGTTMSPGFEFADYESGEREKLQGGWPEWKKLIGELSRK
jgi:predicted cupin superfamily sugar epimerase